MSKAKERYSNYLAMSSGDMSAISDYVTELQEIRKLDNNIITSFHEEKVKLKKALIDARKYIQNIYNNTDPCTCPPEGDCVCGQPELIEIMKKIDEVIG